MKINLEKSISGLRSHLKIWGALDAYELEDLRDALKREQRDKNRVEMIKLLKRAIDGKQIGANSI